jgi:hypothetical protein
MRRVVLCLAALVVMSGAATAPAPAAAAKLAGFCGLYCDAIYLGCRKTIGWFDLEACQEWHDGCLDGCRVNQPK